LAENRKFFLTLSHLALSLGVPFRMYEKALRFLKLQSFRQPTVKIWWS